MPISVRFVVQSTIILLAIGFATLLAFVGMTTWFGERGRVYSSEITEARDTRISAVELRSALQSAESSQRGFLTGGNEIYLAPYDTARAEATRQVERLTKQLAAFPDAAPMMTRLSAIVADKFDEMDRTVAFKKDFNDAAAAALFRTNRGKALMDEANLFFTSIIRMTDARISKGVAEQQDNAEKLRWAAIGGALLIVIVVGMVTTTIIKYASEVAQARDAVRNLNTSLELRVKDRTIDLGRARDRAEALLSEVNHRVANSLTLVSALVRLQANALKNEPSAKAALDETQARITAISMVHKRLYTAGEAGWVELDEYLKSLLEQMEVSMRDEGHRPFLRYQLEPLKLGTDASINLAVIVSEWVTNAVKYAYPGGGGEVRVSLKNISAGRGELSVEDDGIGRSDTAVKGTGLGSRLVTAMASTIGAEIEYYACSPGLGARLIFPVTAIGSAA